MKRLLGLSALALAVSSTSGCGWLWGEDGYFRDRGNDYLEARETAPMQVPASADAKRLDPLLPIPRNVSTASANPDFEVPRPQPLANSTEVSDFSLQKSGESRWVVAQKTPAEVWPMARQFFESNGFRIAGERPQVGEFSTAWQRFDELSAGMARRLSSRVSGVDPEAETRVRVRIEPGVVRNTSEVFVLTVERPAGSTAELDWPARSSNRSLEAALLDEMMVSMARAQEQGGSVSLLAARDFDAPNRVSLGRDGSGNPLLTLDTSFDRAWSSVGRALEMADIRVDDINRSLGVYYVNLAEGAVNKEEEPGFFSRVFSSEPSQEEIDARAERYQVRLTTVGKTIQITLDKDINTVAPAETAERVLQQIEQNLGS